MPRLLTALLLIAFASPAPAHAARPAIVLAAGDIGQCDTGGAALTAELIRHQKGSVLALGDLAYRNGSAEEFARCYAPHWGSFLDRTRPAPGNHDYRTANASAYFAYFGARAGDPASGYYSFDLGDWHIVSLNSNRELDADSAQARWLDADLRTHRQPCVLAYWHHPRHSSGPHGSDPRTQALWEILVKHGASVVLAGHDHTYERFAPMNALGEQDETRGLRSFVVGTGGAALYDMKQRQPFSQAWNNSTWGVLKLVLEKNSYTWEFLPVAGGQFKDAGRASCNRR